MKNLSKIVSVAMVTAFITACASSPTPYQYKYWGKEGVTPAVAKDKIGHCRTEVGADKLSKEQAKKLVTYCMKADGYKIKSETRYR